MSEPGNAFGAHPRLRITAAVLLIAGFLLVAVNTALYMLDASPGRVLLLAPCALILAGAALWFVGFLLDQISAPKPPSPDLREPPFD